MAVKAADRKDIYERVTERMIEKLETGTVPWRQPWKSGFGMPCNANTKRPYRGWNAVVTLFSGYGSQYWATYKGWTKLGGQVRKGEKGTLVIGWKSVERKVDEEKDGVTRTKTKKFLVGFGFTVFNEEQVDGATVPKRKTKAVEVDPIDEAQELLDAWIDAGHSPIKLGGNEAGWSPMFDTIVLPQLGAFDSAEHFYGAAYHEMAHATGDKSRLDRWENGVAVTDMRTESYSKEELVAELAASFVSATVGIQNAREETSAAYIAGWLERLRSDKKFLISAASKAQAAADFILGLAEAQDEVELDEAEAVA